MRITLRGDPAPSSPNFRNYVLSPTLHVASIYLCCAQLGTVLSIHPGNVAVQKLVLLVGLGLGNAGTEEGRREECMCACACVRACAWVRACVRACVRVCVRACVREREREGERDRFNTESNLL